MKKRAAPPIPLCGCGGRLHVCYYRIGHNGATLVRFGVVCPDCLAVTLDHPPLAQEQRALSDTERVRAETERIRAQKNREKRAKRHATLLNQIAMVRRRLRFEPDPEKAFIDEEYQPRQWMWRPYRFMVRYERLFGKLPPVPPRMALRDKHLRG